MKRKQRDCSIKQIGKIAKSIRTSIKPGSSSLQPPNQERPLDRKDKKRKDKLRRLRKLSSWREKDCGIFKVSSRSRREPYFRWAIMQASHTPPILIKPDTSWEESSILKESKGTLTSSTQRYIPACPYWTSMSRCLRTLIVNTIYDLKIASAISFQG